MITKNSNFTFNLYFQHVEFKLKNLEALIFKFEQKA